MTHSADNHLSPLNAPDLPSLEGRDAAQNDAAKQMRGRILRNLVLGLIWMTPAGYFLTHGQGHTAQLEAIGAIAPYLKQITIAAGVLSALSVLAMAIIIRRAFAGRSPFSLAIGMGLGFCAGAGPAEIMAQLSQ